MDRTVQQILGSEDQQAAIHARLTALLALFIEAKARQEQADRDVRDARVVYEQEYAMAERVGCVDLYKHPRNP
jgi:hypothetical protein